MALRILRLLTGEDIVGEIENEDANFFTLKNPCSIGLVMTQSGKAGLNMQPMLLFSDQKLVKINRQHVTYDVSVAIEIQNKYNEVYGSGIVVAKGNLIT
ncbi:MAG: hypothetical protein EB127_04725 [Alphaproteobacteria bacterium]|nr:hypothetical protein [Alphaproteobacteria bacterium]